MVFVTSKALTSVLFLFALLVAGASATAQTYNDAVVGYVDTVNPNLSYSRSDQEPVVVHNGGGDYEVRFPGAGGIASDAIAEVSALFDAGICYSEGANASVEPARIQVQCVDLNGNGAEMNFTAILLDQLTFPGTPNQGTDNPNIAFAFSQFANPSGEVTLTERFHNPSGGSVTLGSLGPGGYRLTFEGLANVMGETFHVQATAYHEDAKCFPIEWSAIEADIVVDVACLDTANDPFNSRFVLLVADDAHVSPGYGYAYNDDPTPGTEFQVLSNASTYNPFGGVDVLSFATGEYRFRFRALRGGQMPVGAHAMVTSQTSNAVCSKNSGFFGGRDLLVDVKCVELGSGDTVNAKVAVLATFPHAIPANDDVATPANLGRVDQPVATIRGTNVNASVESDIPPQSCSESGSDVWWKLTVDPDDAGWIKLDANGSNAQDGEALLAALSVVREEGGTFTEIACNSTHAPGFPNARIDQALVEGEDGVNWYVRVAGETLGGEISPDEGEIRLEKTFLEPPENDVPGTRITFDLGEDVIGTNVFATMQDEIPSPSCAEIGNDVWFDFDAPSDGLVNLSTEGSSFNTVLSVYSAFASVREGVAIDELACNNDVDNLDGHSRIEGLPVEGGSAYFVRVGGIREAWHPEQGNITLLSTFESTVAGEEGPDGFVAGLGRPTPNPASGQTTLKVGVERTQDMTVAAFDALGRRVQTLFDGALAAGKTETLTLDTATLPAGVYIIRATGEHFAETRRLTVVR